MNEKNLFSPGSPVPAPDLEARLSNFDMRWTQAPLLRGNALEDANARALTQEYSAFGSAPFLGCGALGMMLWPADGGLRLEINSTDVWDRRAASPTLYGRNRVRVGWFRLGCGGVDSRGWDLRLSLWDARLHGTVPAARGALRLSAYAHAVRNVIVLTARAEGGAPGWEFFPLPASSTRPVLWVQPDRLVPDHPPAVQRAEHGVSFCVRRFCAQLERLPSDRPAHDTFLVVAWKALRDGDALRVLCCVRTGAGERETCQAAREALERAAGVSGDALFQEHAAWWHERYRRSAVLLPDAALESFYWVQLYKLLSAGRPEGPVLDLFGPWFKPSGWNAVWANLNVQMAYSPLAAAGHADFLDAMARWLDPDALRRCAGAPDDGAMALPCVSLADSIEDAVVPPEGLLEQHTTIGNLPYCLVVLWERYAVTMDAAFLARTLAPLLEGALAYYLRYLERGADGRLHLPYTWSPEWGVNTRDSNFELALARWCCRRLLEADARLGRKSALAARAREILSDLAEPPHDAAHGLYVGADEPYHHSHRHWSHLFAIYPCGELRPDDEASRALIDASVRQYLSYQELYTGFSWVAIASLFAVQRRGGDALESLRRLLRAPYLWPNTMYTEMGELEWPTLETPVGVDRSVQELLLGADGAIEVFPALPPQWESAGFYRLRAPGGFAVSAARADGRTQWVCVESLAGQPLRLKLPGELSAPHAQVETSGGTAAWDGPACLCAGLDAGGWLLVRARGVRTPDFHVPTSPAHWGGAKPL